MNMFGTIDSVVGALGNNENDGKDGNVNKDYKITNEKIPLLFRDLLRVVKGFRNGLVYGAKIRLPHALVMTFLFRSEPLWEKIKIVGVLTKTHSINLALFVTIYKTLVIIQQRLLGGEQQWHSFLAGCIGGYFIFSKDDNVNNQIVMYLLARVATALVKLLSDKVKTLGRLKPIGFKMEASLVWGLVMYLFRYYEGSLQNSLRTSMMYLYRDSDTWRNLWTLLIHNK